MLPLLNCATRLHLTFAVLYALTCGFLVTGAARASTISLDWVVVGDPGNTADTTGVPSPAGTVADSFQIMRFEWTNSQYVTFLNSVDPNGTNPYSLYVGAMSTDARGGIDFDTNGASGGKYTARANMGDKPVNFVSWFDAARVANWLHNGQGSGSTETGAYTLVGGQTSGTAPARNSNAMFYIPTENQWYKAAYYKGGNSNAGYWNYATSSDTVPTAVTAGPTGIGSAGSIGNFANYVDSADWNGLDGNLTTVGTNGGPSAYGTFDMSGNVWEWNDLDGLEGEFRGLRGGGWALNAINLSSSGRLVDEAITVNSGRGFRLASPSAVPEPSTYAMALSGLALGGYSIWRRRKRA